MAVARRLGMTLSLMALLSACAPAGVAPVRTPLAGDLPRVMSLNPCIDAILLRVADPDQILSVSHYSHDPRSASADVATARRYPANYDTAEEVVAMRPDIVLLGPHVAPATQAAIRATGIRIVSVGVPATIAESLDQVQQVADAVGHGARGQALAAQIEDALMRSAPRKGTRPIDALIREGGGLVPGTATLADELLTRTGFRNISRDYGLAMWDILPLEQLAAHPPSLVLTDLTEHGEAGRLPVGLGGMKVADFPDRLLQCAGPNLIEAAARLATIRRREAGA